MTSVRSARRRLLLGAAAGAALASGSFTARAATWPTRPVKVIVPFPPGGSLDTLSRAVSTELSNRLGQQFVVENRAGANGQIGTAAAARSAPDGYTVLMTTDGAFSIPSLTSDLPYEPLRDFVPLSMMCQLSFLLVSNNAFAPSNLKETIDYMRANPGKASYASPGIGSQHHLAMERFSRLAKVDILNVPYPGASQMVTGLMGDQVNLMIAGVANSLEMVRSNRLKAIAYAGPTRHPLLPATPTFSEAGLPGYEARAWMGAFVPRGTPSDVTSLLSRTIWSIVNEREFTERVLLALGFDPSPSVPPERFPDFVKEDRQSYEGLLREMKLKPAGRS